MAFLKHTTSEGERWDQLSQIYYGRPDAYAGLIEANPTIPIVSVLPAGFEILVPIIETADTVADDRLPPWRRANANTSEGAG